MKLLDLRGSSCTFADVGAAREAKRRGITVLQNPGDELLARVDTGDAEASPPGDHSGDEPLSPLTPTAGGDAKIEGALEAKLRRRRELDARRSRREAKNRKDKEDRRRQEAEEAALKLARARAQATAGRRPAHEPEIFNGLTSVAKRLGM